ncbi:MAG: HAD family phosphatase [Spirochaetes bacterium]|nr:HAD family phosphatase [Spirochaetota bacterium]
MKKTPEAVIFDMDGVLIDSEPLHYEAETSIFKIIGADFTEEERHSFIGTSIRSMYGDIIKRFNLKQTVEELINQDKKIRLEFFSAIQELKPIEGVENLLVLLKKEKIKTAIASSSSEEIINLIIEKLGFADYFDVIVSGDSVLHAKPEPDIFLKTVELLNTDTTKCIIIEDSKNGVIAAKKSGIKVIAYKNINSGIQDLSSADIIVNSINEINPGMISSLLKHKSSLSGKKSSIKILT